MSDHTASPNNVNPSKLVWYLLAGDPTVQRRWAVNTSPFCIGRLPDLSLSVTDDTVSKRHAELILQDDRLVVRDLESTNGTFINGVRVRQAAAKSGDLLQLANTVFRVVRDRSVATVKQAIPRRTVSWSSPALQFEQLISQRAVVPHYQPIVTLSERQIVGYEVLARSRMQGLESAAAMFSAASQFNRAEELSSLMRWVGTVRGQRLPGSATLFLNTHPAEIGQPELINSLTALREQLPNQKMALEIHEAAVTDAAAIRELQAGLRDLSIRLAYDDFGAGQARLIELIEVPPDVLKFEVRLIRDLHRAPPHRVRNLTALVKMVSELGVVPLAEGVESAAEGAACRDAGFHLAQGFHYGAPQPLDTEGHTRWPETSSATICL